MIVCPEGLAGSEKLLAEADQGQRCSCSVGTKVEQSFLELESMKRFLLMVAAVF